MKSKTFVRPTVIRALAEKKVSDNVRAYNRANRAAHRVCERVARSAEAKSVAAGYDPLSADCLSDLITNLADPAQAFAWLDDQEARLGLDLAAERAALVALHGEYRATDDGTYVPVDHNVEDDAVYKPEAAALYDGTPGSGSIRR